MENQRDSNVGVYFMIMIFVGLAVGGVFAVNQSGNYWDRFCAERTDVEPCQMLAENRQKAIGELIKLGDKHGSHAAIPGLPPVDETGEEMTEESEVDVSPTEAMAGDADAAPEESMSESSDSPAQEN